MRRGYIALNKCVKEEEHDPILEPLYIAMGVFSSTIRRYGSLLQMHDPALWLYAREAGGVEKAATMLRRASDNVREMDVMDCRGLRSEVVNNANHTLQTVSSLWRTTRATMTRVALAMTM